MMMGRHKVWWAGLLGTALLLSGCGDDKDQTAGGDTDADTEADTFPPLTTTDDSNSGQSSDPTTGSASDSDSATTTDSGTTGGTGMDDGGFIGMDTGDTGAGDPLPNGAECAANEDCMSEFCYSIPTVGGVCSECLVDQDCETGTCSLEFEFGYAVCTDGSMGNMCNTDEGCMGDLVCAELIDTGGLFNANYCSECKTTADCADGQTCSPYYDESGFSGYLYCVEPASVPSGQGCPVENGTGDDSVCMDGHCSVVEVFQGFAQIGLCGQCNEDTDCMDGQTCTPAMAGQRGLFGSVCE